MSAPIPSTVTDAAPETIASLQARNAELQTSVARICGANVALQIENSRYLGVNTRINALTNENRELKLQKARADATVKKLKAKIGVLERTNDAALLTIAELKAADGANTVVKTNVLAENALLFQLTQRLLADNSEMQGVMDAADGFMCLDEPSDA